MFTRAAVRLTIFYSGLFFLLFWSLSIGIFVYLQRSFGAGYITQVIERTHDTQYDTNYPQHNVIVVTKATEVTLEHLRDALIYLNCILLFIIPILSWFLARRTLSPIQSALKKQRQFVSDASHELRTPLAIVESEIDVALKKKRSAAYYERALIASKDAIAQLSVLVNNLLILARSDYSREHVPMVNTDIGDVVTQALVKQKNKLEEKSINYHVVLPDESVLVYGNSSLLERLFSNIIDNAIKFSPIKGKINVTITERKKRANIAVTDEGIGIIGEEKSRIFDRFYRADYSRSANKGFGLGLSIAQAIASLHQGSISVASMPGKGSTFTVQLPVA